MEDLGNGINYKALLLLAKKNSQLMVFIPWPQYKNSSAAAAAPSRDGWRTWTSKAEVSAAPLTSRKADRLFQAEHFGEAAKGWCSS